MRTVDASEVLDLFNELIEEFGAGFVYSRPDGKTSCFNWHNDDGRPGCIIGWLMRKLGASDDLLAENHSCGSNRLSQIVGEKLDLQFTELALSLMADVQAAQDMGDSWGKSVHDARQRLGI